MKLAMSDPLSLPPGGQGESARLDKDEGTGGNDIPRAKFWGAGRKKSRKTTDESELLPIDPQQVYSSETRTGRIRSYLGGAKKIHAEPQSINLGDKNMPGDVGNGGSRESPIHQLIICGGPGAPWQRGTRSLVTRQPLLRGGSGC